MRKLIAIACCLGLLACTAMLAQTKVTSTGNPLRQRISINAEWRFFRYDLVSNADSLIYDVRPMIKDNNEDRAADDRPTEAVKTEASKTILKPWILPTGNDFIKDTARRHVRPDGNPGSGFPFTGNDFDDSSWEIVDLPHDWAVK
jgi:beta-galactosidase